MARLNLPSPQRTVRQGITVCLRMGYTREQALTIIRAACANAIDLAGQYRDSDPGWLGEVHMEASAQLIKLREVQK